MDHRRAAAGCPRAPPRRHPRLPWGRALSPDLHTESHSPLPPLRLRHHRDGKACRGRCGSSVGSRRGRRGKGRAPARPAPPLPLPGPTALSGGARTPRTPAPPPGGSGGAGPRSARGCAAPAAAPARPRLPQKNKSPAGTRGGKGGRKNNSRGGKRECSQSGNSLFISQKYILSCTIWFTHMYIFTVCTKTNNNNKKIETPNPHWTSKNRTNSANPDDNTEAGIFFSFLVLIYRHAYKL